MQQLKFNFNSGDGYLRPGWIFQASLKYPAVDILAGLKYPSDIHTGGYVRLLQRHYFLWSVTI